YLSSGASGNRTFFSPHAPSPPVFIFFARVFAVVKQRSGLLNVKKCCLALDGVGPKQEDSSMEAWRNRSGKHPYRRVGGDQLSNVPARNLGDARQLHRLAFSRAAARSSLAGLP